MRHYMEVDTPSSVLEAQIFVKCPLVPGDDLCELRFLSDIGYALKILTGYGLWSSGIMQLVRRIVPPGPTRNLALAAIAGAFARIDTAGIGILQPGQTLVLLRDILNPGLTEEHLRSFL